MIIHSTDQIKAVNVQAVRSALSGRAWHTIAHVVRATQLSVPTVGRIIDEMLSTGEALTSTEEVVTGGRRAKQYMLDPGFSYALCIYLDQQVIWYHLSNVPGDCVEKGELPVQNFAHRDVIGNLIEDIITRYPALKAVSIGVPAWVHDDELREIMEYPGLNSTNFRKLIDEYFELPCRVTNDLNALVTGYCSTHYAGDKINMCGLYISSSGPGAGVVINGTLRTGFAGFAGEIGYLPVSGGTLNEVLLHSNGDYKTKCRAIAETVATIAAVINPRVMLFCTYGGRMPKLSDIKDECRKLLPEEVLPEFIETSEYHRYYLTGLRTIADDLMRGSD